MNPELQHKVLLTGETKVINDEEGIIGAFVAVIGNKDSGGDIIMPGAFDKFLKTRKPKAVWSHDWERPVGKTLTIEEIKAGDARLPAKLQANGWGALYVETQFNLRTDEGRNAYENVKFFDGESEWSIGYRTHVEEYDRKASANLLKEVELYEYSPVLFGMNAETSTAFIKTALVDGERKIELLGIDESKSDAIKVAVAAILADPTEGEEMGKQSTDEKSDEVVTDENVEIKEEVAEEAPSENEVVPAEENSEVASDEKSEETEEVQETDGEKAVEPVATDVAGGGETKGSPRANRAVPVVDEKSEGHDLDVKALAGSYEERYSILSDALYNEFKEVGYAYTFATFDSKIVYYLYDRKAEEQGYWEADYTIDGKEVTFGEPKAVEVVEVLVLKHALSEALKFDMQSEAEEAILQIFNEKAGRVLSKTNESLLKTAIENIQSVLGTGDSEEEKTEVAPVEEKQEQAPEEKTEVVENADNADEVVEEKTDESGDESPEVEVKSVSDAEVMKSLAEFMAVANS